MAGLRWSSWGSDTAEAHGFERGFHLPLEHIPVNVTLSRIVTCGAKRFYTQLRATSHFGTTVAHSAGCPANGDIGSPTAAPPPNLFGSPSGNILCQAGPTTYARSSLAYCQERAVNPYRDVTLYVGGKVKEGNGGGDPGETPIRTIAYGHSISWKGARCTSLKIGMRCVRTSTGHGFLINLAGIHRI